MAVYAKHKLALKQEVIDSYYEGLMYANWYLIKLILICSAV